MDFDDELDEDLLLATRLSEIESQYEEEQVNVDVDEDFKYALKLSAELNSSTGGSTFPTDVVESDFLLAKKLTEDDFSHEKSVKMKTDSSSLSKNIYSSGKMNSNTYMDKSLSVVDPSWETIDPNPDIYALFLAFNTRFFWGRLDMVEVKWSPRMTLCAGICSYQKRAGHCVVKLSKPLLTYRPRKDLIETLLHEMIHAYLFVTNNDRDREGHGPRFHQHMYRINRESGANITVYHSFHDEVRMYKTHVWKCDGLCQHRAPYYGLVRRSMNRAPGPNDLWWAEHLATCGGKYHKIKEPENYGKKKNSKRETKMEKEVKKPKISQFFTRVTDSTSAAMTLSDTFTDSAIPLSSISGNSKTFSGSGSHVSATIQFKNGNSSSLSDMKKPSSVLNYLRNNSSNPSSLKANSVKSMNGKIVTLADLSKNSNKRSPMKSPSKSPKKWAPLPGQKNILSFIHKF